MFISLVVNFCHNFNRFIDISFAFLRFFSSLVDVLDTVIFGIIRLAQLVHFLHLGFFNLLVNTRLHLLGEGLGELAAKGFEFGAFDGRRRYLVHHSHQFFDEFLIIVSDRLEYLILWR